MLKERASESLFARFVWWVKRSEAEGRIAALERELAAEKARAERVEAERNWFQRKWEQLAAEAIADAGQWKAEARKLRESNAELLEALVGLISYIEQQDMGGFRIHPFAPSGVMPARAAIAKATGKAP